MKQLAVILLSLAFGLMCAQAQAPTSSQPAGSHQRVAVMRVNPEIQPPTLAPVDLSPFTSDKCERKLSGKVQLALIVDFSGRARNITFLKPDGGDIDRLAIVVAERDRFAPARHGQNAVAMGRELDLDLHGCVVKYKDGAGNERQRLMLASAPAQELKPYDLFPPEVIFATEAVPRDPAAQADDKYKVGGNIAPPKPINTPEAEFSAEGRAKGISGECMFSLFVDAFGLPEDIVLVKSLEPTMDQKALEAVNHYRFKPAMRNGIEPVPVKVTIAVNFRLGGLI